MRDVSSCWLEFDSLSPISNIDGMVTKSHPATLIWLSIEIWVWYRRYRLINTPQRLSGKKRPRRAEPECTSEVREVSNKVDSVLSRLLNATTYEQVITARYEVDKLILRDSWLGCEEYLRSYLNVTSKRDVSYTSIECTERYGMSLTDWKLWRANQMGKKGQRGSKRIHVARKRRVGVSVVIQSAKVCQISHLLTGLLTVPTSDSRSSSIWKREIPIKLRQSWLVIAYVGDPFTLNFCYQSSMFD